MARRKRPGTKKEVTSFLLSQFGLLTTVDGFTEEFAVAAIKNGGYFLYEGELQELIKDRHQAGEMTKEDAQKLVALLNQADAVEKGASPKFGEGGKAINSVERITEIINDPADIDKAKAILDQMVELRNQLKPLISTKSDCSIALKNKKPPKAKSDEANPENPAE